MSNYIFIRSILDFYINHIFGNYQFVLKSSLMINYFIVVNLFIMSLFFVVADYYDLKFGIIPNKLSLILFVYALLFNLMFGLLDWYNMGASFVSGLLWIWGYRKRKHLIVPMIAHGGANLIGIIFNVLTAGMFR